MGKLSLRNVFVRGTASSSRTFSDPVADFTTDIVTGTVPLTVNFTDTTTNSPNSWAWDFNNDGTVDSTVQNPSYTYNTPGTYAVKLVASNISGSGEVVKTALITVDGIPTYVLTRSGTSVNEGSTLTITLTTQYVEPGTSIPYTITGVSSSDLSNASLTGNLTVTGTKNLGTASVTFNINADNTFEGTEILVFSLNNNLGSISVPINDTSSNATYTLSKSASQVIEGMSVTLTLTTANVPSGTTFPYTISGTGITASDFSTNSLTGSLTVTGTLASASASVTLTVLTDGLTEGTETFTFALDNGRASTTVLIYDTSLSGEAQYTWAGTYTFIPPAGVTTVHAVAVGGGGSQGGAGGGLGWRNNIAVTPGQSYTVVVGAAGYFFNPGAGGDSYFINTSTVRGGGGAAGRGIGVSGTYISGGTFTGQGGGNGGGVRATTTSWANGGGGAGGYSGAGGDGGGSGSTVRTGGSGVGGAGGGGGSDVSTNYNDFWVSGHGGGVGLYGQGNNGAGGVGGASGGATAGDGAPGSTNIGNGVGFGYGGGSFYNGGRYVDYGGAVRIIWGAGKSFPNNAV